MFLIALLVPFAFIGSAGYNEVSSISDNNMNHNQSKTISAQLTTLPAITTTTQPVVTTTTGSQPAAPEGGATASVSMPPETPAAPTQPPQTTEQPPTQYTVKGTVIDVTN